jgi:hypothetical protein
MLSLGALLLMSDNSVVPDNSGVKKNRAGFRRVESRFKPTTARSSGHK